MPKFITTTEIAYGIEKIVKEANDYIFIVTPFLKIPIRLKAVIEEKLSETDNHFQLIVVGKEREIKNNSQGELNWLHSQKKIRFFNCNNLHAKCYLNEQEAIVTSMNLWEYSFVNNIEFGFSFHSNDEHYSQLLKEVFKISSKNIITDILKKKREEAIGETILSVMKSGAYPAGKKVSADEEITDDW